MPDTWHLKAGTLALIMQTAAGSTDRRVDKLIHLLVKNATVVVPGPKIASEIGVTRFKVWRWIESLRLLGVEIRGVPAEGYQLVTIPDILVPSLLRAELGDHPIGRNIVHYFRTDSTNAVALKLAAEGTEHGTVVVAEEQTAGRGRLGRAWYSEKSSGIYTSIILRPPSSSRGRSRAHPDGGLGGAESGKLRHRTQRGHSLAE